MTDSTTTVAKPAPSKADAALKALSLVRAPKTDSAVAVLHKVGEHIASDGDVRRGQRDVKSLTEELAHQRAHVDGLVTYRNRAIRTAQSVGFTVSQITEAYSVSRGTVQNVANATKVREALKAGGTTNPPSADAILSKVSNLGSGALPAIIEHAKTTGELLDTKAPATADAPKAAPTVKSVLTRAESLSDAIAAMDAGSADRDSLAQLVRVLESALSRAKTAKATKPASTVVAETIAA